MWDRGGRGRTIWGTYGAKAWKHYGMFLGVAIAYPIMCPVDFPSFSHWCLPTTPSQTPQSVRKGNVCGGGEGEGSRVRWGAAGHWTWMATGVPLSPLHFSLLRAFLIFFSCIISFCISINTSYYFSVFYCFFTPQTSFTVSFPYFHPFPGLCPQRPLVGRPRPTRPTTDGISPYFIFIIVSCYGIYVVQCRLRLPPLGATLWGLVPASLWERSFHMAGSPYSQLCQRVRYPFIVMYYFLSETYIYSSLS